MADKSKQHWLKTQERKRKEAEREKAEFEALMKKLDSVKSDILGFLGVVEPEYMMKEGEQNVT